ncbi:MAG: FKBP-type peptidyl-prolyl cis-trans isomerase [Bifidobacteriaceae bacterium]|jgi:peptidylprolyl isomerase|nr:FKBP-type peptidyl-prolyl cis-trans isomerase [Bifidobacteriaceae bacterium]
MKRTLTLVLAVGLSLALAGCSEPDPSPNEPSLSPKVESNALAAITWVDGEPPALRFTEPFELGQPTAWRLVEPGDGAVVEPGDAVRLDYLLVSGQDGVILASTYAEGSESQPYQLALTEPAGDYLWSALNGQKVGAKVLAAFTDTGETDEASGAPATYIAAVTILQSVRPIDKAEGETVQPEDPSLPVVTIGAAGEPSIEIPSDAVEPSELVVQVLIQGQGQVVEAVDAVTANYTGWLWDGTEFDSSWSRGQPSTFALSNVITGWRDGLAGLPVGSRVLLVVPPDQGYGESGQASIPGDATLIFVVEILGAV